MKKLLLVLPMSLLMTYAWSQNQGTDKKTSNTNSLDGRSFKITMSGGGSSMMDSKEHSSVQTTTQDRTSTKTNQTTYDQTQSGKTDNPDQNSNYDKNSSGKN